MNSSAAGSVGSFEPLASTGVFGPDRTNRLVESLKETDKAADTTASVSKPTAHFSCSTIRVIVFAIPKFCSDMLTLKSFYNGIRYFAPTLIGSHHVSGSPINWFCDSLARYSMGSYGGEPNPPSSTSAMHHCEPPCQTELTL